MATDYKKSPRSFYLATGLLVVGVAALAAMRRSKKVSAGSVEERFPMPTAEPASELAQKIVDGPNLVNTGAN